jgi:CelD/BcsL family acetyltransferase involved in cellulose biosynthesis
MDADLAASWSANSRSLPSRAPLTGPFPHPRFLEAWAGHCAAAGSAALVAQSDDGALPIWVHGGIVRFQGDADLTDYHTPLGGSIDPEVGVVAAEYARHQFSFDSLPAEAVGALEGALARAGATYATRVHATALVLDLPQEPSAWLSSLARKHRHEVRRKQRRLVDVVGTPHYDRRSDDAAFAAFVSMHRTAAGEKGQFMTDQRVGFFRSLLAEAGASIDLLSVEDRPIAAAFGFAEPGAYYLYNSAYDPTLSNAAPGIVLLSRMLDRSVADGVVRFDFLKGAERYKYHLGARERTLSVIEGVFA